MFYHTALQTIKTLNTAKPMDLYQAITSDYPYRTRNATIGQIRQDETFRKSSFKYRARQAYNQVPVQVRTGYCCYC